MHKNPKKPKDYDAVLGGNTPDYGGVVLGGIEGVKSRFDRSKLPDCLASIDQRITALKDALNYGEAGLDLVIQALDYAEWFIHQAAYSLLYANSKTNVKQALLQYTTRLAKE